MPRRASVPFLVLLSVLSLALLPQAGFAITVTPNGTNEPVAADVTMPPQYAVGTELSFITTHRLGTVTTANNFAGVVAIHNAPSSQFPNVSNPGFYAKFERLNSGVTRQFVFTGPDGEDVLSDPIVDSMGTYFLPDDLTHADSSIPGYTVTLKGTGVSDGTFANLTGNTLTIHWKVRVTGWTPATYNVRMQNQLDGQANPSPFVSGAILKTLEVIDARPSFPTPTSFTVKGENAAVQVADVKSGATDLMGTFVRRIYVKRGTGAGDPIALHRIDIPRSKVPTVGKDISIIREPGTAGSDTLRFLCDGAPCSTTIQGYSGTSTIFSKTTDGAGKIVLDDIPPASAHISKIEFRIGASALIQVRISDTSEWLSNPSTADFSGAIAVHDQQPRSVYVSVGNMSDATPNPIEGTRGLGAGPISLPQIVDTPASPLEFVEVTGKAIAVKIPFLNADRAILYTSVDLNGDGAVNDDVNGDGKVDRNDWSAGDAEVLGSTSATATVTGWGSVADDKVVFVSAHVMQTAKFPAGNEATESFWGKTLKIRKCPAGSKPGPFNGSKTDWTACPVGLIPVSVHAVTVPTATAGLTADITTTSPTDPVIDSFTLTSSATTPAPVGRMIDLPASTPWSFLAVPGADDTAIESIRIIHKAGDPAQWESTQSYAENVPFTVPALTSVDLPVKVMVHLRQRHAVSVTFSGAGDVAINGIAATASPVTKYVNHGGQLAFVATPRAQHHVQLVKIVGDPHCGFSPNIGNDPEKWVKPIRDGDPSSFSMNDVDGPCAVDIIFATNAYALTLEPHPLDGSTSTIEFEKLGETKRSLNYPFDTGSNVVGTTAYDKYHVFADAGTTLDFKVHLDGYTFANGGGVYIDGSSTALTATNGVYTITVSQAHTIRIKYRALYRNIHVVTSGNGTVTMNGVSVSNGGSRTFVVKQVTPNAAERTFAFSSSLADHGATSMKVEKVGIAGDVKSVAGRTAGTSPFTGYEFNTPIAEDFTMTVNFDFTGTPEWVLDGVKADGKLVSVVKPGTVLKIRAHERHALPIPGGVALQLLGLSSGSYGQSSSAACVVRVPNDPDNCTAYEFELTVGASSAPSMPTKMMLGSFELTDSASAVIVDGVQPNAVTVTPVDNVTRFILTGSDVDSTRPVTILAALEGQCLPGRAWDKPKNQPISYRNGAGVRLTDILTRQNPSKPDADCNLPAGGDTVILWTNAVDAAGHESGWLANLLLVDLDNILEVSYGFSEAMPFAYGIRSACAPTDPLSEGCAVDVHVKRWSFGESGQTGDLAVCIRPTTEDPQSVAMIQAFESTGCNVASGWIPLVRQAGLAHDWRFSATAAQWPANAARTSYAVGFDVDRGGTHFKRLGAKPMVLDNTAPEPPTLTHINGIAVGTTPLIASEPSDNVSPTFDGMLGNGTGSGSDGFVTIDIYDAAGAAGTKLGEFVKLRTERQRFNTTYINQVGNKRLLACNESVARGTDVAAKEPCTFVAVARVTGLNGVEGSPSDPVTFILQSVVGLGAVPASKAVDPITADGQDFQRLTLNVRDRFGNRIPDAALSDFCYDDATGTWTVRTDASVCDETRNTLLPPPATMTGKPSNVDLIADDDDFDASAVILTNPDDRTRADLAERVTSGQAQPGVYDGNLYVLAPTIDTLKMIPKPGDASKRVLNPTYGRNIPVDLDMRFALGLECRACGADLSAYPVADAPSQEALDARDAYLARRTADGISAVQTTNPADVAGAVDFFSKVAGTNTLLFAPSMFEEYVRAIADVPLTGDVPTTHPNYAIYAALKSDVVEKIPTVNAKPIVTTSISEMGTNDTSIIGTRSIAVNGGLDRLISMGGVTTPAAHTLGANASAVSGSSPPESGTVTGPVHGGGYAVRLGNGGSFRGSFFANDATEYVYTAFVRTASGTCGAAPLTVTPEDGTPVDLRLAGGLTAIPAGTWVQAASAAVAVDRPEGTMEFALTSACDVIVDTITIEPQSADRAIQESSLVLGVPTSWRVDLKNESAHMVNIDTLNTLTSLSFRYGTALWGDFRNVAVASCPLVDDDADAATPDTNVCDAPVPLDPTLIAAPTTQSIRIELSDGTVYPRAPYFVSVLPGEVLRVTFTGTAGVDRIQIASTEGVAESIVAYPFAGSDLSSFSAFYGTPQTVRYPSSAIALNIFNPRAAIAGAPHAVPRPSFDELQLAGIRKDIRNQVELATRALDDAECADDSPPQNMNEHRTAKCLFNAMQARRTYVLGNDDASALTEMANPDVDVLSTVLAPTRVAVGATLPEKVADILGTGDPDTALPLFRDRSILYVPGNLVLQPKPGESSVKLPEGKRTVVVRGNVFILGNIEFSPDTKSFGIVVLPVQRAANANQLLLSDEESASTPGGNVFIDPNVTLIEGSLYVDGAIFQLDPRQDDDQRLMTDDGDITRLAMTPSFNDVLANSGMTRIMSDHAERPQVLMNQLLFSRGHVISMRNTWGGARLDLPSEYTSAERLAVDLSAARTFTRDESGVPLFGGSAAPGISTLKERRNDSVVIQPAGATMGDLPELFSRIGAFSASEKSRAE